MIHLLSFSFIALFLFQGGPTFAASKDQCKEITIIGGGVAGLTAGYLLKDFDLLLLEKENRVGGRVFTKNFQDNSYDMGALIITFKQEEFPIKKTWPPHILEKTPLGLYHQGKLYLGFNPHDILEKLQLSPPQRKEILDFSKGKLNVHQLTPSSFKIVNALFKGIHLDEIGYYTEERQRDGFIRWSMPHFTQNGNTYFIQELSKDLQSKINLDSEVLSVDDQGTKVEITYKGKSGVKKICSSAVIVATPGSITKKILKKQNPVAKKFLASIRYAKYTVVSFLVKDFPMEKIWYLMTTDHPFHSIYMLDTGKKGVRKISFYYGEAPSQKFMNMSDDQVIAQSLSSLNSMKLAPKKADPYIIHRDIKRWQMAGPIISNTSYSKNWDEEKVLRPSSRVFLAGDYVSDNNFPWGMQKAFESGRRAAGKLRKAITQEKICSR